MQYSDATTNNPAGAAQFIKVFILLVLMITVAVTLWQLLPTRPVSHGVIKHGAAAITARQCKDSPEMKLFWNQTLNRWARICKVKGKWYIQVLDEVAEEITGFCKEKMCRFEQIENYMNNRGYVPHPGSGQ